MGGKRDDDNPAVADTVTVTPNRETVPGRRAIATTPAPGFAVTPPPGGGPSPSRPSRDYLLAGLDAEGYEIIDRVGEGGMGVVYAVYDRKLRRKVAIKVMRPSVASPDDGDGEYAARMLREAQSMAKLSHQNVASVHQVGTIGNSMFIVMEFLEGGTLGAWRCASPRKWHEIVDVLVKAGRGLEAAHRAGIIHRDFKPENIMIGSDGRVRVTDFGLARAQPSAGATTPFAADANVTTSGMFLGTPAYMAPEQFRSIGTPRAVPDLADTVSQATSGAIAHDARADQFAFCVTLYEALCGTRPFAGTTISEVMENVTTNKLIPFPSEAAVPRSIRQIVLRGLSPDPAARFPSMTELLAELERRPGSRLNLVFGVTVTIAALAFGVVLLARGHSPTERPCMGSEQQLAKIWNPSVRQSIAKLFDSSTLPYAVTARDSVLASIDQYGSEWVNMHRDACQATRVRGEQSELLLDRRMSCLELRSSELAAFTQLLASGTPEMIQTAVVASRRLSPIEDCSGANQAHVDSPTPETRIAVDRLGGELARAKVLLDANSFEKSLTIARDVNTQAKTAALHRIEAEALLIAGKAQQGRGQLDDAQDLMIKAVGAAKASNQTEIETEAYVELVYLLGWDKARPSESVVWATLAESGIQSGVGGVALEARLLYNRGAVMLKQGRPAEALDLFQRSRVLRQKLYPQGHPDLAHSIDNVGSTYQLLGEPEKALTEHKAAVAMFEKLLGADHPSTADTLNNLANDYASSDRLDEAEKLYRRALDIYTRSLGPAHASVAISLSNLGTVAIARKDYKAAIVDLDRALKIEQAALGAAHPTVAETMADLGRAELEDHQTARAVESLSGALAIWGKLDQVPPVGEAARFVLARAIWQRGDHQRALDLATTARDHLRSASDWTSTVDEIDAWLAKPK